MFSNSSTFSCSRIHGCSKIDFIVNLISGSFTNSLKVWLSRQFWWNNRKSSSSSHTQRELSFDFAISVWDRKRESVWVIKIERERESNVIVSSIPKLKSSNPTSHKSQKSRNPPPHQIRRVFRNEFRNFVNARRDFIICLRRRLTRKRGFACVDA